MYDTIMHSHTRRHPLHNGRSHAGGDDKGQVRSQGSHAKTPSKGSDTYKTPNRGDERGKADHGKREQGTSPSRRYRHTETPSGIRNGSSESNQETSLKKSTCKDDEGGETEPEEERLPGGNQLRTPSLV